jgi:hypothetical protein
MIGRGLGMAALALAVVTFMVLGSAYGQLTWHTLTGPDRAFTADIPSAPKYSMVQMKTGAGAAYVMHQYVLEQGNTAYVVQTATYPGDVNVSNPRANLQGGLDNAAKNMEGGKWGSIDWTTHQGLTAVSAIGARDGNAIRSFSVLKGRQIVSLTYAGPPGSARKPDVNHFVASLRLRTGP